MGLFKKSDLLSAITNRATKKIPQIRTGLFKKKVILVSAIRNRATQKKIPPFRTGLFKKKK